MKQFAVLILTAWQLSMISCSTSSVNKSNVPGSSTISSLYQRFPDQTNNYKEIRCWLRPDKPSTNRLLVFRKNSYMTNWTCFFLAYRRGTKSEEKYHQWKQLELKPQIIQKLRDWQIETLEDEKTAKRRWRTTQKEIQPIISGNFYEFEVFLNGKRQHCYSYSAPFQRLRNWDVNNKELMCVTNIIAILEREFDFKVPAE